jgi:hypothetical protein
MAQCMRTTLNPPKTLLRNPTKSSPVSSPLFHLPKSKKHSRISMSQQNQQELSLDSLISSTRKEEVLGAIKGSLSNCLWETNLLKTVPALKSKVRGKVIVIWFSFFPLLSITIIPIMLRLTKMIKQFGFCCRWEIYMMAGIILFWSQQIGRAHLIKFSLLFPSKDRSVH